MRKAITRAEAKKLAEARALLQQLGERATHAAIDLQLGREGKPAHDEPDEFDYGMVRALSEVSEGAIFDLMNVLTHHMRSDDAKEFLHGVNKK